MSEKLCPKCGGILICHVVFGEDETACGFTERFYGCNGCFTWWTTRGDGEDETPPERYYLG